MKLINNVLFLFVLVSLVNSISCQIPDEKVQGDAFTQQYVADKNQSTLGSDGETPGISDDQDDNDNRLGTENSDGSVNAGDDTETED